MHGFFPASFLPPFLLFTLTRFPCPALQPSLAVSETSVQFSCSVMSDSLRPHGLQHNSKLPCPSPTPRACSNSCPSCQWCHPAILSFDIPFYSCLQIFPASGSFQMSQFFASGGQSIGASASASAFQWIFRVYFFRIDRFDLLAVQRRSWESKGSQESSPTPQFKNINSFALSFLYSSTLTSIHDDWKNHSFDWTDLCWLSDIYVF